MGCACSGTMYTPKHFRIQELVPPAVYKDRGELAITLIDERLLMTLDALRNAFGVCTVNNWLWDGPFTERCFRTPDCKTYRPYSQHTFGRACDCSFRDVDAQSVRDSVIKSKALFPHISFIEDAVSWFHFDVRNCQRIQLWNPDTDVSSFV